MSAFLAVYLRELLILRRRLKKHFAAMAVSPLLYMLTFGCALGGGLDLGGRRYIEFLLPGLAAMASMTQAFGIASEINIARFYTAIFEEIQASPAGRTAYALGEVAAALTRMLLGCAVIVLLGMLFGVHLRCGPLFWLAAILNGFAFASLAVALAMAIRSHADQGLLGNFVITPMAFLGGTFFPVDSLPDWARHPLSLLPLTHASRAMRAVALGESPPVASFVILACFGAAFFLFALYAVGKARD
ncbi:MAG: ABC transporter permease [Planctomycetota bacterium]|jgi:ABC-type multidrug transport system permease subunit|nr:ABC transporter permease [Planctomycetota bacterium]